MRDIDFSRLTQEDWDQALFQAENPEHFECMLRVLSGIRAGMARWEQITAKRAAARAKAQQEPLDPTRVLAIARMVW